MIATQRGSAIESVTNDLFYTTSALENDMRNELNSTQQQMYNQYLRS